VDSAIARYDWGRWVADCPNPACTNALLVQPGQTEWLCRSVNNQGRVDGCLTAASLVWPDDPAAIAAGLAGMPESEQNWRPEGE